MLGIAVGEHQADADPVDTRVQELGGRLARVLLAERRDLLPEDVHPAPHALHPLPGDERRVVVVRREVQAV